MNQQFILLVGNHGLSRRRKAAALVLAWVVDGLRLLGGGYAGFLAPLDDLADLFVAVAMVFLVGVRWQVMAAFALELVPGVAAFPTWTALVVTLPVMAGPRSPGAAGPAIRPEGGEP
jgi:hypothetical protein